MHIDRTNQIPMTGELTGAARPISVLGLVCMSTVGTPARCASFRAGEAHYVGGFAFVGEVVDVLAIFPASHALIVMAATVLLTDPMRIANEEGSDLLLHTKVNHFAGRFVSQIPNTTFSPTALLVLGPLQFLPATRIFGAARLLPGKLAQLLMALAFERTNATSGDDHGLTGVGGDGCQMDLAQIYGSGSRSWSFLGLWRNNADMQFKAVIPDQAASTALLWKGKWQHQGCTPSAHRQNHPSWLDAHSLSRPMDRIKPLGPPGIFHAHLWMCLAKLTGRLDGGKKGMDNHLN
jgi:hypothetical protein